MNQAKSDFETSANNALELEQTGQGILVKSLSILLSLTRSAAIKRIASKEKQFLSEQLEEQRQEKGPKNRQDGPPKVSENLQEKRQPNKPPPLKTGGESQKNKTLDEVKTENFSPKPKESGINKEEVKKEVTNQTTLGGRTRRFSIRASELTRIVQTLSAKVPFIVEKEGNNYFLEIRVKDIPVLSQTLAQNTRQKIPQTPKTTSHFKTYHRYPDRGRR